MLIKFGEGYIAPSNYDILAAIRVYNHTNGRRVNGTLTQTMIDLLLSGF